MGLTTTAVVGLFEWSKKAGPCITQEGNTKRYILRSKRDMNIYMQPVMFIDWLGRTYKTSGIQLPSSYSHAEHGSLISSGPSTEASSFTHYSKQVWSFSPYSSNKMKLTKQEVTYESFGLPRNQEDIFCRDCRPFGVSNPQHKQ